MSWPTLRIRVGGQRRRRRRTCHRIFINHKCRPYRSRPPSKIPPVVGVDFRVCVRFRTCAPSRTRCCRSQTGPPSRLKGNVAANFFKVGLPEKTAVARRRRPGVGVAAYRTGQLCTHPGFFRRSPCGLCCYETGTAIDGSLRVSSLEMV